MNFHRVTSSIDWNGVEIHFCYIPHYEKKYGNIVVSQIEIWSFEPSPIPHYGRECIYFMQREDTIQPCVADKVHRRLTCHAQREKVQQETKLVTQQSLPLF